MNDGKVKTVKVKHPDSSDHFLIVNEEDAGGYTMVEEKPEAKKDEDSVEAKTEEEKPARRRAGAHVGQ